MKKILITGAAGNLGGLLAKYIVDLDVNLNLMMHKRDVIPSFKNKKNINIYKADLLKPHTLIDCVANVDIIVHKNNDNF